MTEDLLKDCGEEELIRQICAGQTELFCTLIAPYQRTSDAIAYSVLNNAADAEEIAQEAFLRALKSLSNFRAESKFSTWLIQITLNEARGRLRGNRAHLHHSLNGTSKHEDGDFVPRDLADWREIPSEALARKELRENIEQVLRTLRPIYREILVLRDIEHFSVAETAEALGISKGLVKTRLLRARLKMREALAPGYDGSWTSAAKESSGRPINPTEPKNASSATRGLQSVNKRTRVCHFAPTTHSHWQEVRTNRSKKENDNGRF